MEGIILQVRPIAGQIQTNFDEIERQLAVEMGQYDGIIFTEDTRVAAKKKVAELRKIKKDIDDSRKEIKSQWMEPYNQFEARVKQMTALVDKPINYINGQVEAFEAERLKVRQTEIQKMYDEEVGGMADFLPLYRIQSDKWQNASTSTKAIRKEMAAVIAGARAGRSAIESMQSDAVPDALRKFQASLNLPDALNYITTYEAQRAEVLKREEERRRQDGERQRQTEIERIRAEERQRVAEEERIRREAEAAARTEVRSVDMENAAPLTLPGSHAAVYTVVGTDEELQELEMAMMSLGLYFERKDI